MSCSGVRGMMSSVTSYWFQIVQTNSVCSCWLHSFVQAMNGRQVLIDIVCRWLSGSLINFLSLTNWKYWSRWLSLTIIAYTVGVYWIWDQSDVAGDLFPVSPEQATYRLINLDYQQKCYKPALPNWETNFIKSNKVYQKTQGQYWGFWKARFIKFDHPGLSNRKTKFI